MKKRIIKAIALALASIFLISVLIIPASADYSAPIINPCDGSYVMDDLSEMGYNPYDYPYDPSASFLQVIHFLEYGYARDDTRYYSLYLYLYNPSGKKIAETGSRLQLSYIDGGDETKALKYSLEVVNASTEQGSENVFYKLELKGVRDIGRNIDNSVRIYSLESLEVLYEGETKPVTKTLKSSDAKNRCKWKYRGYQAGFGTETDTLYYITEEIDTIPVELHDASWMSDTSSLGEDYRWEVKSYYFNIPHSYIRKYGDPFNAKSNTQGLYAVEGEYYKYGLNGLIVPDQETYDKFLPSVNTYKFPETIVDSWESFFKLIGRESTGNNVTHTKVYYDFSFNKLLDYDLDSTSSSNIHYSNKNLIIYNLLSIGNSPTISKNTLTSLWEASGKPVLSKPSRMYMGDKTTNIGERVEFDVKVTDGDLGGSIKTYASRNEWGSLNWLHRLLNKDFYTDKDGYLDCMPLVQIQGSDVSEAFKESVQGKNLYLNYDSYTGLQSFYNDKKSSNNIYLMRLGVEPYYESDVTLSTGNSGYYYEKVIHKDVDIFSFTFKNLKGEKLRVPVECDPVDNLGSVVEGNNKDDNNPNGYPDDPTPGEILWGLGEDLLNWLDSLKGIVILVVSTIGIAVIAIFIIVFWKYLEPWFQRAGRLLGRLGRGLGAVFGFVGKLLFGAFKAVWNIAVFVVSIFFPPAAVLRINASASTGSSNDSKYYYEDRAYKQKEEQRRQERHEAEMEALKRASKKPSVKDPYKKEKAALKKAIEKDKSALKKAVEKYKSEHAQLNSGKTYNTDEFFDAAVKRTQEEFLNNKKE